MHHLNRGMMNNSFRDKNEFHCFIFSEPGANMRHIRKPNPKPIEI
jgi:hypothetical protein